MAAASRDCLTFPPAFIAPHNSEVPTPVVEGKLTQPFIKQPVVMLAFTGTFLLLAAFMAPRWLANS